MSTAAETPLAPRYIQAKNQLRREIARSDMKPGDRFFTTRELATRLGVSTVTASRTIAALQEEGLLVARKGKGIFIGEPAETASAQCIALVTSSLLKSDHPYMSQFVEGVEEECARWEYHMGMFRVERGIPLAKANRFVHQVAHTGNVAGMVFMVTHLSREEYQSLLDRGVAVVLLGTYADPSVWCVEQFPEESFRDALDFLTGLGHRRIGSYLGIHAFHPDMDEQRDLDLSWRIPRWHAYKKVRQALIDAGQIDGDPALCPVFDDAQPDAPEKLCAWYFAQSPRPTALFLPEEKIAWRVVEELRASGVRVPEDVSVMSRGTDESPDELTLWQIPAKQLGSTAIRLLHDQMQGVERNRAESIFARLRRGKTVKVHVDEAP